MEREVLETLRVVWDSLYDADEIDRPADMIIAFGCADPMVARRAAELWLKSCAPLLVFSGGLGKGTEGRLATSEAEHYAAIAHAMGVPYEKMLLETRSTNTGENIRFSYEMVKDRNIRTAIAVHQTNMGRRIRATLQKQWPDPQTQFLIAPADRSLEDYISRLQGCGISEYELVSNIVGDFQRMELYARMGYQTPVKMPLEGQIAFERMKRFGYTKYIVEEN